MDRGSLVVAVCMLAAASAHAAHPLITEDTGTQGSGNQQLEVNVNRFDFTESKWQSLWGITWSYGVAENADLQIGIPYFGGSGKGDLAVDFKWRYWQSGDFSLGAKPGFTLPTGDEEKRIGAGEKTYGALLFFTYEPETWALHGQAGYRRFENVLDLRKDLWQFSGSFWLKPLAGLKLVSDLAWTTDPREEVHTWIRTFILGAIWSPVKNIDLDAGIRWDRAYQSGESSRAYLLGLTYRW
jgi:hypothetical protein